MPKHLAEMADGVLTGIECVLTDTDDTLTDGGRGACC